MRQVAAVVGEADQVDAMARGEEPELVVGADLVPLVGRIGDPVREVEEVHGK